MRNSDILYQKTRKKLPPYAKSIAERQKYQNLPLFVAICIGLDSWARAKKWQRSPNDIEVMVATNEPLNQFHWPVSNCFCVVDWGVGPGESQIVKLVETLIRCGAVSVTVRPLFVNLHEPVWVYDAGRPTGEHWVQIQEKLHTYYPSQVVRHVV